MLCAFHFLKGGTEGLWDQLDSPFLSCAFTQSAENRRNLWNTARSRNLKRDYIHLLYFHSLFALLRQSIKSHHKLLYAECLLLIVLRNLSVSYLQRLFLLLAHPHRFSHGPCQSKSNQEARPRFLSCVGL